MTINFSKSLKILFFLQFVFLGNSYCQEKGVIRIDTMNNCFIVIKDIPYDYSNFKKIDSLIKSDNDTSIIKIYLHSAENSGLLTDFDILYKNNNNWKLANGNHSIIIGLHTPFNFDMLNINELRNVLLICPMLGSITVFENYYYFFIVNKKIIKSYYGDIPINKAIEVDAKLASEFVLFTNFDNYLNSKKRD